MNPLIKQKVCLLEPYNKMDRIYIEITNRCNLTCSFCPSPTKSSKQMSIEEFTHIIQDIHTHTQHIYLHVQGEPLTHPHLLTFLDIAYKYKLKVHIVTNGTLLDQISPSFFTHPALAQLSISFHAWEEFSDEAFKRKLDSLIEIKALLFQNNTSKFLRIWNKKSERMTQIIQSLLPDVDSELIQKLGKHRIKIDNHLYLDLDDQFAWPHLDDPFVSNKGRCHSGIKLSAILTDGTFTPCCLDPQGILSLGNIYETSMNDLLKTQRFNNLVSGFKQNKLVEDLCQHCSFRTRFK